MTKTSKREIVVKMKVIFTVRNTTYISSSENKFRPVWELNPWPLWYQYSALPAELFHYCSSSVHHCKGPFHINFLKHNSHTCTWFSYSHNHMYSSLHRFTMNQPIDQPPVALADYTVSQRSRVQIPCRPEFFSGLIFTTAYMQEVIITA